MLDAQQFCQGIEHPPVARQVKDFIELCHELQAAGARLCQVSTVCCNGFYHDPGPVEVRSH